MILTILLMNCVITQVLMKKRSDRKGGGVFAYVHNSLNLKTRLDLPINTDDVESVTLVITRLIVINILPLTELFCNFPMFCNCPLLKDITFNTKCLLVWCD